LVKEGKENCRNNRGAWKLGWVQREKFIATNTYVDIACRNRNAKKAWVLTLHARKEKIRQVIFLENGDTWDVAKKASGRGEKSIMEKMMATGRGLYVVSGNKGGRGYSKVFRGWSPGKPFR